MSLALLFHYLMLNMFRMLIHPSSGACDLFAELFHRLYWSGSMCAPLTLWFGWGGVVSVCRLRNQPHQHISNQSNTTREVTQQISRKLLRMDVLTSETCWALNDEIIKQVTSSCSLFIQLSLRLEKVQTVPLLLPFLIRRSEIRLAPSREDIKQGTLVTTVINTGLFDPRGQDRVCVPKVGNYQYRLRNIPEDCKYGPTTCTVLCY